MFSVADNGVGIGIDIGTLHQKAVFFWLLKGMPISMPIVRCALRTAAKGAWLFCLPDRQAPSDDVPRMSGGDVLRRVKADPGF